LRTSFDDVRRRGHGGAANLRLQAVPLLGWKATCQEVDLDDQRVRELKDLQLSRISAHGQFLLKPAA